MGKGEGITKYFKRASIEGDGSVQEADVVDAFFDQAGGAGGPLPPRTEEGQQNRGPKLNLFLWRWIEK